MLYPFLCVTHRQWLTSNIPAAKSHYSHCLDTAQYYIDTDCWKTALPYCGSAYETAEIILANTQKAAIGDVLAFTHSAILLANGFQQLQMMEHRQHIFCSARERLRTELARDKSQLSSHPALLECYASLDLGYQHGELIIKKRGDSHASMSISEKYQIH